MFKGISNFAASLRQIQQMGGRMKEMNERLQQERVTGQAGGGMVTVEVNGLGETLRVQIDPSLMNDREMLEDLLPAAINQATAKAKQFQMQSMTDGLSLPGLDEAMQQLSGQDSEPEA